MASTSEASGTLISRVESFVSDNKKAIVAGAAFAVAAGGVGYYLYTQQRKPGSGRATSDLEKSGESKKKKKSQKKKKVGDDDGPILEERKPKPKAPEPAAAEVDDAPKLTKAEIEALPEAERLERANAFKARGNAAYTAKQFPKAVDLYTQAIEISPKPEAVYFSNRAASYLNFSPPQYPLVVADCDEALSRDPKYLKALSRRAGALEQLGRLHDALRDYTTLTILERFQNEAAATSLERVLKRIAQDEAKEIMKTRPVKLPSYSFIYAYLAAFRPRALPVLPAEPSQGDKTLLLAAEALQAQDYTHGFSLVHEAIEQGISWTEGKAEAANMRGTFKFLCGDSKGAKEDLEESLALVPSFIQSWVKIASVHMDLGNPEAAFDAFTTAVAHDPKDPDIYYHRGQVHFIMQRFDDAESDYNKSVELDSTFVFSHIQLAVAQYKRGNNAGAMATFRRTMKAFPNRSEPLNYYGELLLDQERYNEAVEKFDRAIEIERKKSPMNVLSIVNKALTIFQWQQDVTTAEKQLREALDIDPECDSALTTLAQLVLQQGRLSEATELFARHASIARTEPELEQSLTYKWATQSQQQFLEQFPDMAAELGQIARAMQGGPQ
ncbi:ADP/ATP carrier receptor [Clavulina sp. PMI_390]|nr:ADP/ATP carrier receptor [Clavulina sp. PMI_390]